MNIDLILAIIALFVAASSLVIVVGVSLRIHRLEYELHLLKQNQSVPNYYGHLEDIPAFLRRQAD